jgi:hypothetical protein
MCPNSPSTDKVPDIAAEPVNGNPALTPVKLDPSPVKEPVKEPVSWVLAIVSSLFTREPDRFIDPVD